MVIDLIKQVFVECKLSAEEVRRGKWNLAHTPKMPVIW